MSSANNYRIPKWPLNTWEVEVIMQKQIPKYRVIPKCIAGDIWWMPQKKKWWGWKNLDVLGFSSQERAVMFLKKLMATTINFNSYGEEIK